MDLRLNMRRKHEPAITFERFLTHSSNRTYNWSKSKS